MVVGGSGQIPLGQMGKGQNSRVPPQLAGRNLQKRTKKDRLEEAPGPEERRGGKTRAGQTLTQCPSPHLGPGEPYVTIKTYTAILEDEVSLKQGETIEVIHKLLDGWWVIR